MSLRWKKDKKPTGLARVTAGPVSSTLSEDDVRYAVVSALRDRTGWYWVAGWQSGVPHMNSCNQPVATEDEAKAQAFAYVKEHYGAASKAREAGCAD